MLELSPGNVTARRLLSERASREGQSTPAQTVRNLLKKGSSYEADKLFAQAIEFYEQALALEPTCRKCGRRWCSCASGWGGQQR